MILLGRVYSNLMIDMPATNDKLRRRALRMVELASGSSRDAAFRAVQGADGDLRAATVMAALGVSAEVARQMLEEKRGDLRSLLKR
jgi:N-acetylmuramic acid 6-phosphate etherase